MNQVMLAIVNPDLSELHANILAEYLWFFINLTAAVNVVDALAPIQWGIIEISLKCLTFINFPSIIENDLSLIGNIIS